MKRIISVSRRTDVPAFYGDWFIKRVKEGAAGYVNPFGGKKYSVSLARDDVHCIVFWSKNYAPFFPRLEELHRMGFNFYFQFTITGLPESLEGNVPHWKEAVDTARRLAEMFSPNHVIWRFDPIVFSTETPPETILENFRSILKNISGSTRKCYFSFVDYYGKVRRNFEKLHLETGIRFRVDSALEEKFFGSGGDQDSSPAFVFDLTAEEQADFALTLAADAAEHDISLYSCCEDFLITEKEPWILKGHCVDPELITEISGATPSGRLNPTRKDCGCWESRDIGAYDTCPHGCVYCYANTNKKKAAEKFSRLQNSPDTFSLSYGKPREDFSDVAPDVPAQDSLWNDYNWFNYFKK
ncbi:DUF1848 domain-containing protein [bacterium]